VERVGRGGTKRNEGCLLVFTCMCDVWLVRSEQVDVLEVCSHLRWSLYVRRHLSMVSKDVYAYTKTLFLLSLLMYSMCHMWLLGLQLIDILDVYLHKLDSLRQLRNWSNIMCTCFPEVTHYIRVRVVSQVEQTIPIAYTSQSCLHGDEKKIRFCTGT